MLAIRERKAGGKNTLCVQEQIQGEVWRVARPSSAPPKLPIVDTNRTERLPERVHSRRAAGGLIRCLAARMPTADDKKASHAALVITARLVVVKGIGGASSSPTAHSRSGHGGAEVSRTSEPPSSRDPLEAPSLNTNSFGEKNGVRGSPRHR